MDVSGSMYRFNSRDKRLERMLEAALLVRRSPWRPILIDRFTLCLIALHSSYSLLCLQIMTAMPSGGGEAGGASEQLEYSITGHSGESDNIKFVPFGAHEKVKDEKKRLQILQEMIAHSQFCMSGDHTLEAAARAVRTLKADSSGGGDGGKEVQYQR